AVRPAVDGDFQDVSSGVESARAEHAGELLANVAFVSFERRGIELDAPQLMLLAGGTSGLAGCFHHVDYDRLVGLFCAFIATDADGKVEVDAGVVHAGRVNSTGTKVLKRSPVAEQYVAIEQRNFLRRSERCLLRLRQFRRDVGNHYVPARQNAVGGAHRLELVPGKVADLHFFGGCRIAAVVDLDHGAVEPDAHRRGWFV